MKRQISQAILGVAILLVIGLGTPLAVVVQRFYDDRAVLELQRRAAQSITEITLPLDRAELAQVASEPDTPGAFTVYDSSGQRVSGPGPAGADAGTRLALAGRPGSRRQGGELVLALPITDRGSERIVGAVRVTEGLGAVDAETRRAWAVMAAAVTVALAGTWLLARAQGRRLAAPVISLAGQAETLGRGEFAPVPEPSGLPEVDVVAAALTASAQHLAALLARERAFSSDVAHQVRTPLTGLRLQLERARREGGAADALAGALGEIDRLERTVEDLLALARDEMRATSILDVAVLLEGVQARWSPRLDRLGRTLAVDYEAPSAPVSGASVSIGQVLDVLIDNSTTHGDGTVTLRARRAFGGYVLEVQDEGDGIDDDERDAIFERNHGTGTGIGLALARTITEAEGGRLQLATTTPPRFQVVLPAAVADLESEDVGLRIDVPASPVRWASNPAVHRG